MTAKQFAKLLKERFSRDEFLEIQVLIDTGDHLELYSEITELAAVMDPENFTSANDVLYKKEIPVT
jgi:hypothetical protein